MPHSPTSTAGCGKARPPRAPQRVEVRNGGTPQAAFVFDEFGNAVGGVRSPYLDVPASTYRAKTPGQGVCGNLLSIVPFDWVRLEKLYGSHTAYATKVGQAVDRLVRAEMADSGRRREDQARQLSHLVQAAIAE